MRHLDGKKILVIDDEADLTHVLCSELEEQGAVVFFAKNARDGLQTLQAHQVDLVVTDIELTGGGGQEFLAQIKKTDPFSPVVFLITGYSEVALEGLYQMGASAIFSKPFALGELIAHSSRFLLSFEVKWYQSSDLSEPIDLNLKLDNILPFLGQGGLFLPVKTPYPLGQELSFDLSFKNGPLPRLRGLGRVRWSKKNQALGLEFASIQKEDLDALIEVVQKHAPIAHIPGQKNVP